jgi:hypothetical protein
MGNRKALEALLSGKTVPEIEWAGQTDLDGFLKRRAAVLLYK